MLLYLPKKGCENMAIQFDGSVTDQINFAANAAYNNLSSVSVIVWEKLDSIPDNGADKASAIIGKLGGWDIYVWDESPAVMQLRWRLLTTASQGIWKTSNNAIVLGTLQQIVATHVRTIASDPIFYINGSLVASSEAAAPTGTVGNDSAGAMRISNSIPNDAIDGIIRAVLIYNRILSAQEIENNYKTRNRIVPANPVFNPCLIGAAGNPGDGGAMAAGNTIVDRASGVYGVPNGSPILLAENQIVSW
jgi:hypothetical protein